jgi:hypothetical protein
MLDVECPEDCILLSIQKKDIESLYLQVDGLESFFLRKLENAFVDKLNENIKPLND